MSSTVNSQRMLSILKTVLESSDKRDLISLNNIIFLAQYKKLINLYDDFILFGKMGVSSSKLGWHYNSLLDKWKKIECNEDYLGAIKEFGKRFSNYNPDKVGLLVYYLNIKGTIVETELEEIKNEILNS